jgi:hypothetical protein
MKSFTTKLFKGEDIYDHWVFVPQDRKQLIFSQIDIRQ